MKKIALFASLLIAFSAASIFAAEITFSGSVVGRWVVVSGNSDSDSYATFFNPINGGLSGAARARLNAEAINDANTFGAWMQFRVQASGGGDFSMLANAWWQPLDVVKLTFGYLWGGANPIGVVLTDDDILAMKFYGRSANYIPWAYEIMSGAHAEIKPVENLYILLSVPLDNKDNLSYNGWNTPYRVSNTNSVGDPLFSAEDIFKHNMARIAYTIPGIGTARFTFAGGTGNVTGVADLDAFKSFSPSLGTVDASVIDIGFELAALENFKFDLGFEIPLSGEDWLNKPSLSANEAVGDIKAQVPYAVNLRTNASLGAFNFAGGLSGKFGGGYTASITNASSQTEDAKFEQGFIFGATLNPSFDAGILIAGIVGELEFNAEDKYSFGTEDYTYDSKVNWKVIPYVQKNVFSGGTVYAGFEIASNLSKSDSSPNNKYEWEQTIDWSIPIGLVYYF
jgi:hypothetical protein